MRFTWNELAEIFGETTQGNGGSWANTMATRAPIDNPVTIGGKQYYMPSSSQYSKLIETPNSSRATVNYYPASFAAVSVDLTGDATYSGKGWNGTNGSHVYGYLFFPDEAVILDSKILVSSLNDRWENGISELTADDLQNYGDHGCMFFPATGVFYVNTWYGLGSRGYFWTGYHGVHDAGEASRFGVTSTSLACVDYARSNYFPVVLVETN